MLAVHTQVLHAAHELPVADGEVLREFGDASEEQRPGQVQRSERRRNNASLALLLFCIINIKGRMREGGFGEVEGHEKFITEAVLLFFSSLPGEHNRKRKSTRTKEKRGMMPWRGFKTSFTLSVNELNEKKKLI